MVRVLFYIYSLSMHQVSFINCIKGQKIIGLQLTLNQRLSENQAEIRCSKHPVNAFGFYPLFAV